MKQIDLTRLLGALVLLGASQESFPYEIETHEKLAEEAAILSVLR